MDFRYLLHMLIEQWKCLGLTKFSSVDTFKFKFYFWLIEGTYGGKPFKRTEKKTYGDSLFRLLVKNI